ncbi:MAG: hypothetical protein ACKN9D_15185 [Actinomycetales bacterium]
MISAVDTQVVMFIRHGEKPGDDGPPHGIDHDGERDPHALSVRGWTRAGALAALFSRLPDDDVPDLRVPSRVIATRSTSDYHSKRELNTASPVAHRLGLHVDTSYGHDDAAKLATGVLAHPDPTLIVWHHGSMVDLVQNFPIDNRGDIPADWPHDRFDLIWVLTRPPGEANFRFSSLGQGLLEGDVGPSGR